MKVEGATVEDNIVHPDSQKMCGREFGNWRREKRNGKEMKVDIRDRTLCRGDQSVGRSVGSLDYGFSVRCRRLIRIGVVGQLMVQDYETGE